MVVVLFVFSTANTIAQQKNKTHKVVAGETVIGIATKYHVTPYDLLKVNPDLKNPPAVGTVIIIPEVEKDITGIMDKAKTPKKSDSEEGNALYHIVKPKETLFSLSKKYNVNIDDFFDANPHLVDGLKVGMRLVIPKHRHTEVVVKEQRDTTKFIMHIIQPKETRWGICHKYSITDDELMKNNPITAQKINIGDTLWIPKAKAIVSDSKENISLEYTYYEVKPKDTLYGISRRFNITIDQIRKENPIIDKEGLEIGMVLRIPKPISQIYDTTSVVIRTFTDLPNDSELSNSEKIEQLDKFNFPKVIDVALMLPFYVNKNGSIINNPSKIKKEIEADLYSKSEIALGFYNGALMAIDSLKKMGLSVRLRVYDTQRDLNVVKKIMAENDFSKMDVVIGPLYTENVEYVADALKYDNVLVVSPLSKQLNIDDRFNLVQAMPTKYTTKNKILQKIVSESNESTNVVIFGGRSDVSSVEFVKTRLASKIGSDKVKTHIARDNLVARSTVYSLLHKNKDNVVIIDSDNKVLITDVITAMNQLSGTMSNKAYLLGDAKALEQLEVSYLNNISLTYPSDYLTLGDGSKLKKFDADFKNKFKYYPTLFSYRGFDVTYDILLSLGSNDNSEVGLLHKTRRGVKGKFKFVRKPFGGYYNVGVFLVRYDDWKLKDISED